jgi:hypothetical protein
MNRIHTLRSISDELGRDKRTVQTWYSAEKAERGEFGELIDGTRRFNDEEREWLVSHYCETATSSKTPITPVSVETGNHSLILASPQLPQAYSLESLRQSEAVSFEDPLAVAEHFLQVADQVTSAMQLDIQTRQQRLQQTRQAKDTIAAKKQQLELEARLYQLQTSQLDSAQTQETQGLQTALSALQQLGKPE